MNKYKIWLMPENKIKGPVDKWIEQDSVNANSRKELATELDKSNKNGTWKLRLDA